MANPPPGLIIAAAHSGAGKTTITMGFLRVLRRRGVSVRSAKCGPDYIDPGMHALATGRPTRLPPCAPIRGLDPGIYGDVVPQS